MSLSDFIEKPAEQEQAPIRADVVIHKGDTQTTITADELEATVSLVIVVVGEVVRFIDRAIRKPVTTFGDVHNHARGQLGLEPKQLRSIRKQLPPQ